MKCNAYRQKLSAYLDGELSEGEAKRLETHLESCVECMAMKEKLAKIGEELNMIRFAKPHDDVLDKYESHVFTKIERGTAWILLSISAAVICCTALFYISRDFLFNPQAPLILRLGVGAGLAGLVVLAVGVVRHRLATRKTDKYKGVVR